MPTFRRLLARWAAPLAAVSLAAFLVNACSRGGTGRVMVVGMDGLDPRAVDLLMSEGKLPHFAKLRQEGAYGRLLSSKPMLSPVLWTTVATGKTPEQHGIGHFTAIDPKSGEMLPVTSGMRKVKALWNIFTEKQKKVAVVGWWASWPAEDVDGAMVSDHLCYHFLFPQGQGGAATTQGLTDPPDLAQRLQPLVRRPADVTLEEASAFIHVTPEEFARPFAFEDDVSHFKWALATADTYRRVGLKLWRDEKPDVLMAYTEGTDSLAHLFGHLFRAENLSGELLEQQKKFGHAVEQMYVYADGILGDYMDAMDGKTTLVVLSDHGFDLGATQDDPSKTRDMRRVSERFHNLEGVLYLYGRGIKARARLDQPKLLDIAPTVLALAGLPAARDMPGRVIAEALDMSIPGPAVATYETGGGGTRTAQDAQADPQILERLKSLGYIGGAPGGSVPSPAGAAAAPGPRSPTGERNIAALHFEAGRYQQAADAYRKLLADDPKDASLHTSLAGALGAMGQYDEAAKHLELAMKLDPLNVEAYHNRAVIFERQGRKEQAIELYRRAVRYNAQYEPSRQALVRLVGSADVNAPRTEQEKRAYALAQQAAQAAQHGNYPEAMSRLAEAEKAAPKYALVYQYRSNVAYLMGDVPGAIRALEKGLALEPDNALFRTNLQRLKESPPRKR
jgi:predicted AlkP superfamily phosphohydrolase/phosphomutase/Flp pilus assembly protein TadD